MPDNDTPMLKMVRVDSEVYRLIHDHRARLELSTGVRVPLGSALKSLLKRQLEKANRDA